nr:MAG TPA: hypothetical protein [Caudoviricetes sp.]
MKFKVGDKVKVVRNDVNRNARDAIIGAVGVIKHIDTCVTKLPYAVEFIEENIWYNDCFGYCEKERGYWCCDEMLELVRRKPNECIVIYRKDSDVIALDKRTGEKSIAKCSPDDEFDFNIGAKLAFERLGEKKYRIVKQKKYEVGDKVKFVDKWNTGTNEDYFGRHDDFLGDILTIEDARIVLRTVYYKIKESHRKEGILKKWWFNDNCIEGKAVEINESDEIKVGDYVKVVDCGKLYPYYHQKVKEIANNNADVLAKFRYGMDFMMNKGLIHGTRMKVYAVKGDFYLLESGDGSYILVGGKGIEKCE